jgi:hypothetical protein
LQRYTETSTGHCIKERKRGREGGVRKEEGAELADDGAADVGGVGGVHTYTVSLASACRTASIAAAA